MSDAISSSGARMIRFGLIGLDSPHAPGFTRLLNGDGTAPPSVGGGRVVAAWPGTSSADLAISRGRLDGFTAAVRDLGVPIEPTLEDVARQCDALLVLAVDARTHRDYFERCAAFGKPVYVDTRFALSTHDARAMLAAADGHGALPLAGSPKRFSHAYRSVLGDRGDIDGIDISGPIPMQPPLPGLFWYGIHMFDLVVAALGTGCVEVQTWRGHDELFVATWHDGRIATVRGHARPSPRTRGVIHRGTDSHDFRIQADDLMTSGLLRAIVQSCRTGVPTVPLDEIEHVVALTEAANRSRDEVRPVRLDAESSAQPADGDRPHMSANERTEASS